METKKKAREKQTVLETLTEYAPFPIRNTARSLKRARDRMERGDDFWHDLLIDMTGVKKKSVHDEE